MTRLLAGWGLWTAASMVCLALAILTGWPGEPAGDGGLFATGPQISAEGFEVRPPPLRIPRSELWDREKRRILVHVHEAGMELRASFDMESTDSDPWPALLLYVDEETSGYQVLATVGPLLRMKRLGRIYLAGREAGGTIGAIPYVVDDRAVDEISRAGATVCLPRRVGVGIVRITRSEGKVRYRWGTPWRRGSGRDRWNGGNVSLEDEAPLQAGRGPLLPTLARFIADRVTEAEGGKSIVNFEVGSGVRYADVLRAVECGGGDPRIVYLHLDSFDHPEIQELTLPQPSSREDGTVLCEDVRPVFRRCIVDVLEEGRVKVRGKEYELQSLATRLSMIVEAHPGAGILLRPDVHAPWSICRAVIGLAQRREMVVELAFGIEDPQLPRERFLALPPVAEGRPVLAVEPRLLPNGALRLPEEMPDPEGRDLTLSIPPEAKAGEAYRVILELVRRGAVGYEFE